LIHITLIVNSLEIRARFPRWPKYRIFWSKIR